MVANGGRNSASSSPPQRRSGITTGPELTEPPVPSIVADPPDPLELVEPLEPVMPPLLEPPVPAALESSFESEPQPHANVVHANKTKGEVGFIAGASPVLERCLARHRRGERVDCPFHQPSVETGQVRSPVD
jgi:hypothetical protein